VVGVFEKRLTINLTLNYEMCFYYRIIKLFEISKNVIWDDRRPYLAHS